MNYEKMLKENEATFKEKHYFVKCGNCGRKALICFYMKDGAPYLSSICGCGYKVGAYPDTEYFINYAKFIIEHYKSSMDIKEWEKQVKAYWKKNGRPKTLKWNKFSDKLPEMEEDVLVLVKKTGCFYKQIMALSYCDDHGVWWLQNADNGMLESIEYCTHWMPLPDAQEEGAEE